MTEPLPLTGERTVPGIPAENYWFRRHEAAYGFVAERVGGRTVLEVGCGEGYGTALLARAAETVVGVDYDALTASHAAASYPQAQFVRANLAALPCRTGAVDVVVTLQVIEHVWNHGEFVDECRRVLGPGGLLVVSTPNRLTFSPGQDVPLNPFHTVEFTAAELAALLSGHGLAIESTWGLHAGERLRAWDGRHDGFVDAQLGGPPDAWPDELRRDVAAVRVDDFPIVSESDRPVDESLDLLVLARVG